MRPVRILAVCGSGTVSSAMLSSKIKDYLKENGYGCDTVEMNSTGVEPVSYTHLDVYKRQDVHTL